MEGTDGHGAVLAKAGVPFALSTDGTERLDTVPGQIRALITAGLSADEALTALTKNAAAIAGVSRRLGTLEPRKARSPGRVDRPVLRREGEGQVTC